MRGTINILPVEKKLLYPELINFRAPGRFCVMTFSFPRPPSRTGPEFRAMIPVINTNQPSIGARKDDDVFRFLAADGAFFGGFAFGIDAGAP